MRLRVLEHGHHGRSRLFVWMLRRLGAGEVDIPKLMHHRPDFFGREASRVIHEILRGPSSWTVAERELFAAYTSRLNQCPFCTGTHGAVASLQLGQDVVEAVYADPASAPVSDRVKAALLLVERLTLHPDDLAAGDIRAARAAGLSDPDIGDVIDVSTLFNLINRLADAFAFRVFSDRTFGLGAKFLLRYGYRFFPRFLWPLP